MRKASFLTAAHSLAVHIILTARSQYERSFHALQRLTSDVSALLHILVIIKLEAFIPVPGRESLKSFYTYGWRSAGRLNIIKNEILSETTSKCLKLLLLD